MSPLFPLFEHFLLSLLTIQLVSASRCANASFFEQQLDHAQGSNSSQTFKQQYDLNTQYFKDGGPILLIVGAENPSMLCENQSILHSWAQEVGGVSAVLEHRYFGESLPFGNDSYSLTNVKYLTLENVMSDTINFVAWLKQVVPGAQKSKVLIAGGSYGGFLVTAHRMNHPDVFDAALASSAPVRGFGEDANNADIFNWWNFISDVYKNQSAEAAAYIKNSWTGLLDALQNNHSG